jgi:hypothetical protein
LRIFNVSAAEFQPSAEPGGDVQNALIRFGATHLLGDPSRLPNDKIATAEDVFHEVLSNYSQARYLPVWRWIYCLAIVAKTTTM